MAHRHSESHAQEMRLPPLPDSHSPSDGVKSPTHPPTQTYTGTHPKSSYNLVGRDCVYPPMAMVLLAVPFHSPATLGIPLGSMAVPVSGKWGC